MLHESYNINKMQFDFDSIWKFFSHKETVEANPYPIHSHQVLHPKQHLAWATVGLEANPENLSPATSVKLLPAHSSAHTAAEGQPFKRPQGIP